MEKKLRLKEGRLEKQGPANMGILIPSQVGLLGEVSRFCCKQPPLILVIPFKEKFWEVKSLDQSACRDLK